MSGDTPSVDRKSLAIRIRTRREELRLTRQELVSRINETGGSVSSSTIKNFETEGERKYRLPRRKWGAGPSQLEQVASALGVPLGYLLAAFSQEEISASQYGQAVAAGRIILENDLREEAGYQDSLRAFLESMPSTEEGLFKLPLHSYKNQFAFSVIFQIEKIYRGLEMLIVNEPPLIFWDDEDVDIWTNNMNLGADDKHTFGEEFRNYRNFFRDLIVRNKKSYEVVLNYPTFHKFLERKRHTLRVSQIDDICNFIGYRSFNLVLFRPHRSHNVHQYLNHTDINEEAVDLHECEILSKTRSIPLSLSDTVSIQIMQTPPHLSPTSYFVSPAPKDMILIQKEITRIRQMWAASLDQYRHDLGEDGAIGALENETIKIHTAQLISRLKK